MMASRGPQNGFERAPKGLRWLHVARDGSKPAPSWSQDGLHVAFKECFWSRWLHEGPKMGSTWPRVASTWQRTWQSSTWHCTTLIAI